MTTGTTEGPKIEDDATVVAPPPQSDPGPGIDVGVGEDTIDVTKEMNKKAFKAGLEA